MSGRRRHDGWDGGRLDAQDGGLDPWADDSIGEWDDQPAEPAEPADQPRVSARGAAGAYVRGGQPGGKAYAAPDFPSFRAVDGSPRADRYGNTSQRRSPDGNAPGGQGGAGGRFDGHRDAPAHDGGRAGYQSSGYGRGGSSSNSAGRRDPAGYDAAQRGGDSAANRYQQSAKSPGSRGNESGYGGGQAGANNRGYAPEFMPIDNDDSDDDGSATARPYGRLSIYTLREGKTREFDRLAERAAEGVRTAEPDTLVYVIHVVPKAPQQRIIYEIYRDRAALMNHERQPHIRQFAADRASCVVATNVIDLRLKFAKVAALSPPSAPAAPGPAARGPAARGPAAQGPAGQGRAPQPSWSPRGAPTRQAPAQPAPTPYPPTPTPQRSAAQPPGTGPRVASFTPAADRPGSGPSSNQYPTVGRDANPQAPKQGNSGSGANGAGNTQYGAANSNGYSGASGYPNGGSYSSSGYQSSNGYPGTGGYQSASGGYAGANGYSNSNGYQSGNGANGYGSGYPNSAANSGHNGAASYSASASTQYAPRYREIASSEPPEADSTGSRQGSADRYADDGRQSGGAQPPEWEPRTQGYR